VRRAALALAGAAILAAVSLARVPWGRDLLRRPRTPFDRSAANAMAPVFALLSAAAGVVPAGASVAARTEPPDPIQETWVHRFAVSLLPDRRVLPVALYGRALPEGDWRKADYFVIVGPRPARDPGRLLLETPDGTVWHRENP
jgi:hypothetical protein